MGVELLPWIANRRVCHQRLFNAIKLVHSFCAFDWPFQVSSNLSPVSPVKTEMSTIVLINERAHTRISFVATEAEFRETRVGCSSFFLLVRCLGSILETDEQRSPSFYGLS